MTLSTSTPTTSTLRQRPAPPTHRPKGTRMSTTATYAVSGMTCAHCVHAVTEEVSALPGVTDVRVDLASGALDVTSDAPVDESAVRAAVDEAGYALVTR